MSNSALASLTAQYTDSENEDGNLDETSVDSHISQQSQVIMIPPTSQTESFAAVPNSNKRKKSMHRLVSYQDDTVVSESESSEDEVSFGTLPDSTSDNAQHTPSYSSSAAGDKHYSAEPDRTCKENNSTMEELNTKYAHYSFSLPAEPKGKVAQELVDKIRSLHEKMRISNMDMNRIIQGRKEFRNPSIYEKLIQFCDINEFGTNYSPEIYDPLKWGAESYYEELARVQKNEMWKRQKERKEVDKVEQATVLARKVEEEAKKRKSKWDQPAVKALPQALTTTVTGTKGTVISAFGSLPKKPPA